MIELKRSDRVLIPDAVISREIEGETVVLNLETGVYFGLDTVGTAIWNALRQSGRLEDVYQTVLQQFDVQPAALENDLLRFVNQLASKGLLAGA